MNALERKINKINSFLIDGEMLPQPIEDKRVPRFRVTSIAIFTAAFFILLFKVVRDSVRKHKLKQKQNVVLEIIDFYATSCEEMALTSIPESSIGVNRTVP